MAFTAQDAVGAYEIEDSFNGATSGGLKTFGRNVTVDTFEANNNGQELFEFSNRMPTQVIEQNFSGSFGVSFVLSTFQFLEVFDSNATSSGGGFVPYDFDEPQTFELVVHREKSGITRVAKGCIPQSLEFDVSTDGTVDVTISGVYVDEVKRTGESLTQPVVSDDKDALNFADVEVDYAGSTLSLPRGVTISIENNMSPMSVLGDRVAGDYSVGSLTGSVDTTHAVEESETATLEDMYGDASNPSDTVDDSRSIDVTMDNEKASGSGQVSAVFKMEGFADSYSESGIDVSEEFVTAEVSDTLTDFTIEVTED